jgi:membrane protein YqaA with SNARE-associated domain
VLLQTLSAALVTFGPWGIFLLCLLDSVGIPLPGSMDLLLIVVAAKAPSRAWFAATLAVVGSLAGNLVLYWLCRTGARRMAREEPEPGSRAWRFRQWYRRYGLVTVFIPAVVPVLPLPLKLFVISAGALRTPLGAFLGVILLARVARFYGLAYLGTRMGKEGAWSFLLNNAWTLTGVALALALLFYTLIRLSDRSKTGTGMNYTIPVPRKW